MSQPSVETIRTLNGTGGIEIGNNIANILRNTNAPKIRLFVIDPRKYQQNQPSTIPRQNASSGSGIEKTEILLSSMSNSNSASNGHYVNNHNNYNGQVVLVEKDESSKQPKLNGNHSVNRKRKTSQDISFKNNNSKIFDDNNDNFDSEPEIIHVPVHGNSSAGRQVKSQKKQQEFNQTNGSGGSTNHQDQDQSQSAPKKKKREPPPELQCPSCLKIFLGQSKLRLHYRKFPEHNPNPAPTTTAVNKKKTAVTTSSTTNSQITINSLSTSSIPQMTLNTKAGMKNNDNSQQQQQQMQMIPTPSSTLSSSVNHNHNNHNHHQFGQLQIQSSNKMPKTRPITSPISPNSSLNSTSSSTISRSTNTSSISASLSSLQSNSLTINKRTSEISMMCNNNNNNNNNMNGNSHLNYHHQNQNSHQSSSSKSIEELHIQTDPSLNSPKISLAQQQQQQQMSTNSITLASPSSETSNSPASADPFLSPIKLPKPKRLLSMSLYSNSIQQQLNQQIHSGGICSPLQGISDIIGGCSTSHDINQQSDQFSFTSNCFRSLTRTTPSPNNSNNNNSFHHGLGLGPPPPITGIEDSDLMNDHQQQQSPFQVIAPSPLSNRSLTTPPLFSQSPTSSCTRNRSHHNHNHLNQNIQSPSTSSSSGQKSIWEFAEEKLITLGINQMLLELSDVAERLAKIARDKIIPIREEEEERSSAPIIQVNNPFLSYLMDLPFGTYVFREEFREAGRRQPPPPPSATELSNMSLTGSVELDTIDKFLDIDVINLPHLTNLDFGSI